MGERKDIIGYKVVERMTLATSNAHFQLPNYIIAGSLNRILSFTDDEELPGFELGMTTTRTLTFSAVSSPRDRVIIS